MGLNIVRKLKKDIFLKTLGFSLCDFNENATFQRNQSLCKRVLNPWPVQLDCLSQHSLSTAPPSPLLPPCPQGRAIYHSWYKASSRLHSLALLFFFLLFLFSLNSTRGKQSRSLVFDRRDMLAAVDFIISARRAIPWPPKVRQVLGVDKQR